MKTFEQHINDVIDEYGVAANVAMQAAPREVSKEMVNEAAKRYAKQVTQRTFESIARQMTPYLKKLSKADHQAVVNIWLKTEPVLP